MAEQEYLHKKTQMEKILKDLSQRAKIFNEDQKRMTEDLEYKKETLIQKNDERKLYNFNYRK